MPLPTNLLSLAESHPCFSGVWSHDCSAECVVDAAQPPRSVSVLRCADCLTYHLAADDRLLDPGVSGRQLASALTAHVRRHRGYSLSVGGYHTAGPGFWLSAAYWPQWGAFILTSRGSRSALDALIEAIRHGVITVPDARMSQAGLYTVHDLYLNVVPPPRASSLGALLGSGHVSTRPQRGFRAVTIAEFNPVAQALALPKARMSAAPHTPASKAPPLREPPKTARRVGDVCPVCGETVSERPLLHSTYIGCKCG